ncbi:GMC family oxidoreductase [Nocardia alni]|uniref:GMC family oxidoreductase n=1 Tax=Nocardia alni TaxID=2815723 RepID=UPI001C216E46|nr:FAD-dependent oxidoreductase [Nocardia alni]
MVDVVIVGGGTSGCVVAARSSEDSARSVLLLEAGHDDSVYDAGIRDPHRAHLVWAGSEFAQPLSAESLESGMAPTITASVLGGASAINYLATVRGQPGDYDTWAEAGLPSWSWESVSKAFIDIEHDSDFPDSMIHGNRGPLHVRRWRREEFAPAHRAFYDGLAELGIPTTPDVNDPTTLPALGIFPATVQPGATRRLTVSDAYLTAAVRARANLEIRTRTRVEEILFDGVRAIGVRTGDGEIIHADQVVVCAGAFGSPLLLQRSGIGAARHLRGVGIDVVVDSPGVGGNYQDHIGVPLLYRHDGPAPMTGSPVQTVWIAGHGSSIDTHVFPSPVTAVEADVSFFAMAIFLMRLSTPGSVMLTSAAPGARPAIVMPQASEVDLQRLLPVFETMMRWEETEAFAKLGAVRVAPLGRLDTVTAIRSAWSNARASYNHQVGTCAMGSATDPEAVLDEQCRVRGTRNLRVIDASAMPIIPAGNTYLGCVMIAERATALMTS